MRIKKYIAKSLKEGKQKIRRELGEDAVVLSTRTIKNPENIKEDVLEIVAAIDDISNNFSDKKVDKKPNNRDSEEFIGSTNLILKELNRFEDMLTDISLNLKEKELSMIGKKYRDFFLKLTSHGYSKKRSLEICIKLEKNNIKDEQDFIDNFSKNISDEINYGENIVDKNDNIVAIIFGHSGSGKTTNLVKLALIGKIVYQLDVLMISADFKKVGGFEQLKTFSTISGINYKSVYSSDELKTLIDNENNRNLVLIDTSGNSHFNNEHMSDLKDIVEYKKINKRYLAIDSTTSKRNLQKQFEEYSILKPDGLIITKTDECRYFSDMFESLISEKLPVSYFSRGQRIPDDIEPANKELVISLISEELSLDK